jgi:SAM-dependent methyltransferase
MMELVTSGCPVCGPEAPRVEIARGIDFEYHTVPDEVTVVECQRCRTWRLDPRPADSELPRLYPESYEPHHFDALPAVVRKGRELVQGGKARLVSRLLEPGGHLVDVGCGGGALLHALRAKLGAGARLTGWDFPGPHLDALEASGFPVVRGPVRSDALPAGTVDVFVLNQVIEHLPNPAEVLLSLGHMLRSGGSILIETPDTRGLDARLFRRRHWGGFHFPRHLFLFNGESLQALIENAGLQCGPTTALLSPAFWVQSVHHAALEHPVFKALAPVFSLKNPLALGVATALDLLRAPFAPTSNMRAIAIKPAGVPNRAPPHPAC